MKQEEIDSVLNSFFITQEELDARVVLNEFVQSVSSIIVDEFAQNYLLNNPYLSVYLAHTDGSMLLKKIKEFVAFILTAPVDEIYVKRIHEIGFIHHSIKLEPEKVSYGFWAINEVLNKLALSNPLVQEHKSLISKLLKFVEHIMNNGYYIQQEQVKNASNNIDINIQNELYVGFNIHMLNAKKVSLAVEDSSKSQLLNDIEEKHTNCSFGKILKQLKGDKKYEYLLGDAASRVEEIHEQWHENFKAIKKALESENNEAVELHHTNIKSLTEELSDILDKLLKDSLEDGQLSVRSGMQSMKKMTNLFYTKDYKYTKEHNIKDVIYKAIESTILSEFSWAIKSLEVGESSQDECSDLCINKSLRFDHQNLIIKVLLKESHDTSYLNEIINLLLEVMELHFIVQERELSLIKFADQAESANKSKDIFLANMSHELRTPINAITGFSQILMMKKDTPEAIKKYVEKINVAGNNLLDLVNTILDFAKLESGKMQFKPSLSNISNILTEVRTLISPLAQKKEIELIMPNIISLNLYIDKILFKQVLINLLTNAVKFTHKGGEVSLSIVYNEEKHAYRFKVKDNGVGISQKDVDKLFSPFSQLENTYQKEHKGTGLGLMISKNIIEDLHKGKIWVESVEGEGSSFFIEMSTPMVESKTYNVNKIGENAKHILIVEDSEEYQKILIDNLQDQYQLTITDTINKAKELISTNSYDVLILDFFLTDGVSSEILQFMEKEDISVTTIVISAEDEIHISSSLAGSTNLQCITNKRDVRQICASIRGEMVDA